MKYLYSLIAWFTAAYAIAGPQEGLALAVADARTLSRDDAYATRYLDLTHFSDPKDVEFWTRALNLHVNMMSRNAKLYSLRPLATDGAVALFPVRKIGEAGQVLAIDMRYYGMDIKVWERLIAREPYYHQQKEVTEYTNTPATDQYGRPTQNKGEKRVRRNDTADHLSKTAINELYTLTLSRVPIVTGDWFFAQTSIQADRGGIGTGFGYYDFLGIKTRADYFKIIGLDLEDTRSIKSELLAVVLAHNSGVAQNDRMIVRRGAVDGFGWFTLDFFDNNLDEHNPLAFLDPKKGLKHQAERHFGRLPNGLPIVIACDDKGVLQETAPDKIGPDHTAKGNDARIHPAKSCISCHSTGFLKEINDEVRAIYTFDPKRGYNLLSSPVKDEELRLHSAYLRDFNRLLENDRRDYAFAVKECNGQKIEDASADYREAYQQYTLTPVTADIAAAGIGVDRKTFDAKLRAYRSGDPLTTHTLAGLSIGRPLTRQGYEQVYALLQQITRGVAP